MTLLAPSPAVARLETSRRFLLCPPTYFDVTYAINPWMAEAEPVDRSLAREQWETLRETYERLGHTVEIVDPLEGLPDMVFAANAGTVIDGKVLLARFLHEERRGEEVPYRNWFSHHGYDVISGGSVANEGEGDFLLAGDRLLAGSGFRTDLRASRDAEKAFSRPAVGLRLVDPRFYHLDTALAVLDVDTIAYYPSAFSPASQRTLARLFPDAIIADEQDALALGLNMVSGGAHVVLADGADHMVDLLIERGFTPHVVPMSEFRKAGGAVKCCTLELRP